MCLQTLPQLAPYNRGTFTRCFSACTSTQQRARCLAWAFDRRVTVLRMPFIDSVRRPTTSANDDADINRQPISQRVVQREAYRDDIQLRTPRVESQIAAALLSLVRQVQADNAADPQRDSTSSMQPVQRVVQTTVCYSCICSCSTVYRLPPTRPPTHSLRSCRIGCASLPVIPTACRCCRLVSCHSRDSNDDATFYHQTCSVLLATVSCEC